LAQFRRGTGVKFLACKACSSVSTACSGVALLESMDLALDPNGDGDISDAVDVINMSLRFGLRPARGTI